LLPLKQRCWQPTDATSLRSSRTTSPWNPGFDPKNIDLNAALSFVESHYRSEIQTASVLTAYNEFVEGGAGWSGNVIIHCCNASCFLPPRSFANAATPHRPILCQHADAGDRPGDYEYRQSILCP
jgi:hypothetical protein